MDFDILREDRPLIFFDLETTGTNLNIDRIIEIAMIKLLPDGSKQEHSRLVNPEMQIPLESINIHHITNEMVANEKPFREIADKLFLFMEGCDLAGYNITKFDIPMLEKEFKSCGLDFSVRDRRIIDSFTIYRLMEPRDLTAAYKFFCHKDLGDAAHGALADTQATLEVFEAQYAYYSNLNKDDFPKNIKYPFPKTIDDLNEFCTENDRRSDAIDKNGRFRWRNGEPTVAFGRYNGSTFAQLVEDHPDFFHWILNNDFPEDTKQIARNALCGKFPIPGQPIEQIPQSQVPPLPKDPSKVRPGRVNSSDSKGKANGAKIVQENGVAVLAFSKYKGTPLIQLVKEDRGFLEWILRADFEEDVKMQVRKVLDENPTPNAHVGKKTNGKFDSNHVAKDKTEQSSEKLDQFGKFLWDGSTPIVGFGKYKGKNLQELTQENPGFFKWMIDNDFEEDAKQIARDALDGKLPKHS